MDHVSNRIQLVLMISVNDMLVFVCVMVSPTCSDFDHVRVLSVDYGKFLT